MAADILATEAELEAYLGRAIDTPTATILLEIATAVVQAAAGQRLIQVVGDLHVFDLDTIDTSRYLELPEVPATAVGPVVVGATTVTDYVTELSRGRLYRACGWRTPAVHPYGAPSTVTVTYTHGFATGAQDLQLARSFVLAIAAGGATNPSGAIREQIDDYAVQYDAAAAHLDASPIMAMALRRKYGRGRQSALLVRR